MLKRHERLAERLRDPRRDSMRIGSSSNKHESVDKFQYGGTAVLAYDYLSHMVRSSGADETGLGRWSFLQLEGHKGKRVRIISAYNPCRTPTHHYNTVYSQHKRYFNENKQDVCPRRQFRRDLCSFITTCLNEGESIVLLIDCNENLSKMHALQQQLTYEPLYLIDPIRLRHGDLENLPPTTDKGSYPIDSIFVSPDLVNIEAGGWLQITSGLSDHRPLFIDISIKRLLGKYKNTTQPYTIRRLKCRDNKAVERFNSILEEQYKHHNTLAKIEMFRSQHSTPLSASDKDALIKSDRVCTQAVVHAERNCRKIFAGGKPYTPQLNKLGRVIDAWRLMVKKKLGCHISSKTLKRAAIANGIPHHNTLSLQHCLQERANAYREYRRYAKNSKRVHRPNFLDQLIDDRTAEGNLKEANRLMQ